MGLKIMPKWIETFMNMKKDILALTSTEFQEDLFFSWNVMQKFHQGQDRGLC